MAEIETIYFWSGLDRWSGKPVAIETQWDGNTLVSSRRVDRLPPDVSAIPVTRIVMAMLERDGRAEDSASSAGEEPNARPSRRPS